MQEVTLHREPNLLFYDKFFFPSPPLPPTHTFRKHLIVLKQVPLSHETRLLTLFVGSHEGHDHSLLLAPLEPVHRAHFYPGVVLTQQSPHQLHLWNIIPVVNCSRYYVKHTLLASFFGSMLFFLTFFFLEVMEC